MPDPVATPQPDETAAPAAEPAATSPETQAPEIPATPAEPPSEQERMAAVFEKATKPAEAPPADEEADDEPEPPAAEEPPPAAEPAAEPEQPEPELTDEQKDEAEAKSLGFKNLKATNEFKRMRAAEREAAPKLEDYEKRAKPMAERWEHLMSYCEKADIPPDVFGNGMAMLAGIRSNDLEVMRKTRDGLMMEVRKLNERLGDGDDAVERHPDLARAVEDREITPEIARRVAAERAALQHHQQQHQAQQQTQRQQQEHAAAVQRATQEINAIQAEYEPIDPHFQAKASALIPILKPIFAKLPPAEWAGAFREAYRNAPTPSAAQPPAATRPPPLRNQPLRSTSAPVGSVAAAPRTPEEIMAAAIQAANAKQGVAQ
jgi:hypothetical protein